MLLLQHEEHNHHVENKKERSWNMIGILWGIHQLITYLSCITTCSHWTIVERMMNIDTFTKRMCITGYQAPQYLYRLDSDTPFLQTMTHFFGIRQCSSWWSVLTRNCYNILPEWAEPGEPGQCWPSPHPRRLREGSSGISGSVTRSQSSTGALHHHHRRWIKLKKMFVRKRILII